ncbi:DUF3325 domain-containing protein [Geovibrio thiophilus]|uniref:DUF3325 domain-containing protein n=1 Tax=Geovibrio thiophilus TaxID=139438 RepID=A0A410JZ54_9BACT|nr:DUF3325 domain-containing protein [Geovibrio thiophilus]QAR33460.1 DUF3325 domain-containing protein [Geovibrio thiophilus]
MLYGIISMILSFSGLAALALSLDRHWQQFRAGIPAAKDKIILRTAGWLLLAVSLVPCAAHWGTAIGLSAWFGAASVSGSVLVMLLSYAPAKKI